MCFCPFILQDYASLIVSMLLMKHISLQRLKYIFHVWNNTINFILYIFYLTVILYIEKLDKMATYKCLVRKVISAYKIVYLPMISLYLAL